MRTLSIPCLLVSLAILPQWSTPASAGNGCFGPPIFGLAHEYTAGEMHLQVELIEAQSTYQTNCWTDVYAVQIFRRSVGNQCGPEVQVGPEFLPWNDDPGYGGSFVSGEVTDATVEPNHAYQYIARPLGTGSNDDCILGYFTTGPALICRGTLHAQPDCGISMITSVNPCLIDCFGYAMILDLPVEAAPYINTGTILAIYGEFDDPMGGICNASVTQLNITHVVEAECIVGVQTSTWGAVKTKYR